MHPENGPELVSGRRERKKAATRASISAAATELFIERGFDAVSIRDISEQADVAVATIFSHFSGKEALVFDQDDATRDELVTAVAARPAGVDYLDALRSWFSDRRNAEATRSGEPAFEAFVRLVESTPALLEYWNGMWRSYAAALAEVIAETSEVDVRAARLVAHLAIEGYLQASVDEDPAEALDLLFRILRAGLPGLGR